MNAPQKRTRPENSVFPDGVIDRAWWVRHCTADHFDDLITVKEIIIQLTECLLNRTKEHGFRDEDYGAIESHGELVEWLFDKVDTDVRKIRAYINELDGKRGSAPAVVS